MYIAIYGLGYVGLTSAVCLAKEGHQVVGIDISETKVTQINSRISPIKEPGLEALLVDAVNNSMLRCTTNGQDYLDECDLAVVCVGTPSGFDGSHNMTFIAEVSRQIAGSINRRRTSPLTVVYRSTFRPGTIEELVWPIFRTTLGRGVSAVDIVYNPEFLREAVAISDYFAPPKIVIGTRDGRPNARMDELYRRLEAPTFYTKYREAEFTKFVDNAFHALKVGFANEIGRVCCRLGISAHAVREIFVADTKLNISPYYLRPGGAFGGSCLPKDVRALQFIAGDVGAEVRIIDSIIKSNDAHKHFLYERVTNGLREGASILLLGLAFKAGSDDLRESPKVDMARKLLRAGVKLSIYDPFVEPNQLLGQNLGYAFLHLPNLGALLISREEAECRYFDLVVDTDGMSRLLSLTSTNVFDASSIE